MSELEIYHRQGFGHSSGFGIRPALLIVDFVNGFTDPNQFGGGIDTFLGTVTIEKSTVTGNTAPSGTAPTPAAAASAGSASPSTSSPGTIFYLRAERERLGQRQPPVIVE